MVVFVDCEMSIEDEVVLVVSLVSLLLLILSIIFLKCLVLQLPIMLFVCLSLVSLLLSLQLVTKSMFLRLFQRVGSMGGRLFLEALMLLLPKVAFRDSERQGAAAPLLGFDFHLDSVGADVMRFQFFRDSLLGNFGGLDRVRDSLLLVRTGAVGDRGEEVCFG